MLANLSLESDDS